MATADGGQETAAPDRVGREPTVAVDRPFFVDHSRQRIDDKGRLVLPAAYRRTFAGGGYVAWWGEATLALLTPDEYDRRFRRIRRALQSGETFGQELVSARDALTVVTALSHPFQADVQGRFVVKAELRDRAGLDAEVEIVGAGRRVEIMAASRFEITAAGLEFVDVADAHHDLLDEDDR